MALLLKDFKPIPGKVYKLKNDLFSLCEHEEGFEKDMLVSIVTNGKYQDQDFYQITLDVKPFEAHNKPLEQPVYTDGLTWSQTGFSPYKESSKPIQLYYEHDTVFEDHFEEVITEISFSIEGVESIIRKLLGEDVTDALTTVGKVSLPELIKLAIIKDYCENLVSEPEKKILIQAQAILNTKGYLQNE